MKQSLGIAMHRLCCLFIILAGLLLIHQPVAAQQGEPPQPNPAAEAWILEQLAQGEPADLADAFAEEAERVVSAQFVQDLLSGKHPLKDKNIYLHHLVVNEPVELQDVEVAVGVHFYDSRFASVHFFFNHFLDDLLFNDCVFTGEVDFEETKVDGMLDLRGGLYQGKVNFSFMRIQGFLLASDSTYTSVDGEVSFENITVGRNGYINGSTFAGPVHFDYAAWGENLYADKAMFANIDAPVTFNSMRVEGDLYFLDAQIAGPVDFSDMTVKKWFGLAGSAFTNPISGVLFEGMAADSLDIADCAFYGPVDFSSASVSQSISGQGVQFKGAGNAVLFEHVEVGKNITLDSALVEGSVSFLGADIGGSLELPSARFTNPSPQTKDARGSVFAYQNFERIKVGEVLIFSYATFEGKVSLGLSEINKLEAYQANFHSPGEAISMFNTHIPVNATFYGAAFAGGANFDSLRVDGYLWLENAKFTNSETGVNMSNAEVGGVSYFQNVQFAGPATFFSAHFHGKVYFNGSAFAGSGSPVTFTESRFLDDAYFTSVTFSGPVSFNNCEFAEQAIFNGANFASSEVVDLSFARVGGLASFLEAQYHGGINLSKSHMNDFWISGVESSETALSELNLSQAVIAESAVMKNLEFGALKADLISVGDSVEIIDAKINQLNLTSASLNIVKLSKNEYPEKAEEYKLNGMTYNDIITQPDLSVSDRQELLEIANRSTFSLQVYQELEQYLISRGDKEGADAVYIASRRRERSEYLTSQPVAWVGNLFLEILVGYGRTPELTIVWLLVFFAAGSAVFYDRRGMTLREKSRPGSTLPQLEPYNPFLYSLDLLAPYLNLEMASRWAPRPKRRFAKAFRVVQTLAGWALIPIALLSITGIIK